MNKTAYIPSKVSDIAPVVNTDLKQKRIHHTLSKRINNKYIVSCEDIRNLVSTLYLKTLPGLEEIENDYDELIDQYYQPVNITD